MNNAIAQALAVETSVELAHHKEFKGRASNAAEYVFYKAVREGRAFIQRAEEIPEIIKALASLARVA